MGKHRKRKGDKVKHGSDRPIVCVETTCSVEADWHLVTAYKCSLVKNKYVPDLEHSLSDEATRKLFLGFLETLLPIQQACLSDNLDKEAIAGQQGNNLARQSFDLMPFPSDWLRPAKLGYVIRKNQNEQMGISDA